MAKKKRKRTMNDHERIFRSDQFNCDYAVYYTLQMALTDQSGNISIHEVRNVMGKLFCKLQLINNPERINLVGFSKPYIRKGQIELIGISPNSKWKITPKFTQDLMDSGIFRKLEKLHPIIMNTEFSQPVTGLLRLLQMAEFRKQHDIAPPKPETPKTEATRVDANGHVPMLATTTIQQFMAAARELGIENAKAILNGMV